MRSIQTVMSPKLLRNTRLRTLIASATTALILLAPSIALADVEFWFFPLAGNTQLRVTGTGTNNDFGGVFGHSFSNVIGGAPFDPSLSNASFPVGPILMNQALGLHLDRITLDSDGGVDGDDFSIGFDDLFAMGNTYSFAETVSVPGLAFGLLTVGEYTSVSNRFGTMTLRITSQGSVDPQVPALSLLGQVVLAGTLIYTSIRSQLQS